MSDRPTGFLGLSHLGIISSIGWASFGSRVVGVDLERGPVECLRRGELPIHEPALPELFAAHRDRMSFSTDPPRLPSATSSRLAGYPYGRRNAATSRSSII